MLVNFSLDTLTLTLAPEMHRSYENPALATEISRIGSYPPRRCDSGGSDRFR